MKKWLFYLFLSFPILSQAQYALSPKREYRAVWLTTIKGLDWPKEEMKGDDEAQREHERQLLAEYAEALKIMGVSV